MGIAGRWVGRSKLFNQILRKFEVFLKANNYVGYIEADCLVERNKPYLCDIICSLTGPTPLLLNELQRESWGSFFERLAKGAVKHIKVMSRYGVGVRVFTLPAPVMGIVELFKGIPIEFDGDLSHIRLAQMQKVGDIFATAGTSGFICMPVGHAITLKIAKERAYETLKTIHVPDIMYRSNIGDITNIKTLTKWGYI